MIAALSKMALPLCHSNGRGSLMHTCLTKRSTKSAARCTDTEKTATSRFLTLQILQQNAMLRGQTRRQSADSAQRAGGAPIPGAINECGRRERLLAEVVDAQQLELTAH